jgi:hypothetical protein
MNNSSSTPSARTSSPQNHQSQGTNGGARSHSKEYSSNTPGAELSPLEKLRQLKELQSSNQPPAQPKTLQDELAIPGFSRLGPLPLDELSIAPEQLAAQTQNPPEMAPTQFAAPNTIESVSQTVVTPTAEQNQSFQETHQLHELVKPVAAEKPAESPATPQATESTAEVTQKTKETPIPDNVIKANFGASAAEIGKNGLVSAKFANHWFNEARLSA